MKIGFDNEKYLALQAEHIRQRMSQFGGKLYLEFGGKLFDDYHASRVLPGFQPDSKIRMLETIRDDVEIVIAICACLLYTSVIDGGAAHHQRVAGIPSADVDGSAVEGGPAAPAGSVQLPGQRRIYHGVLHLPILGQRHGDVGVGKAPDEVGGAIDGVHDLSLIHI